MWLGIFQVGLLRSVEAERVISFLHIYLLYHNPILQRKLRTSLAHFTATALDSNRPHRGERHAHRRSRSDCARRRTRSACDGCKVVPELLVLLLRRHGLSCLARLVQFCRPFDATMTSGLSTLGSLNATLWRACKQTSHLSNLFLHAAVSMMQLCAIVK